MSAHETSLVGKLSGDATLTALAPGGGWQDVAPKATTLPFWVFSLMSALDEPGFEGTEWEEVRYLVKAVAATAAGADAVAARIQALLEGATLTITGYTNMLCRREERVRQTEVVGDDRWYHAGGIYLLMADPN